jgi:hypothetical protein
MKFENTKTFNFESALLGMRNPLNSWGKSDSVFYQDGDFRIGENDLNLAQRLLKGGSEHSKFMRQIFVSVNITAPLYWWKEFDTYKISTTANSTSTMHTLAKNEIKEDMFSFDKEGELAIRCSVVEAIRNCERLRAKYVETKDKRYWRALIQLLPEGFNQMRTITLNYANLRNIYKQRKGHKLVEWHEFCDWAESLPYAKELILYRLDGSSE